MKITKRKVKTANAPEFCFVCDKQLDTGDTEYLLNLGGNAGSTFELCRSCLRRLKNRAEEVLEAK